MCGGNDHTLSHSEDHTDSYTASNEMPACSLIQNMCNSNGTIYTNTQPELVSDEKLKKLSSTEGISEVRQELLQTRALVTDLETRLDVIERTSQVIVDELKNLIGEIQYGSESHSTVVDNDRQSEIDFGSTGFNDSLYYIKSNTSFSIPSSPSRTTTPIISTPTVCCDDDNPTFERISATLQSLIHDAELALDRTSKYLDLPKRRSRASSWSSSVSSWIVNKYSPTPSRCGNEHCLSCEELPNGKQNAIENSAGYCVCKQEELSQKQQQIKQYYRQQLERHYDYTKSCNDLEDELQKLMHIAFSSSTMIDEQTYHKDEKLFHNNNNNSNNNAHNSNTMDRHRIDSMHGQLQGINDNTSNISKLRHWMSWEYFRSKISGISNYAESSIEYTDAEATNCMDASRISDEICSEDWCYEYDDDWSSHSPAHCTSSSPRRYSASHSLSSSTSHNSSQSDDGLVVNTLNINPNINIRSIVMSSSFSSNFLSTIIHPNVLLLRYIITSGGVIFSIIRTLLEQSSTRPVTRTGGMSRGINGILGKSMKRKRQVRPMVALLKYLIVLIFGWILGRGSVSRRRITKASVYESSDRLKAGESEEYQTLESIGGSNTKLS